MDNKKLIRFVESFMFLPILTMSMPLGAPPKTFDIISVPQVVLSQKENMEAYDLLAFNQAMDQKAQTLELQAEAIDKYFRANDMPLLGTGMAMAMAARDNNLDWRLLPAIAVRESSGGIHKCKKVEHSFFGWGSCKISFNSDEEAINEVAKNLGGNDSDTERHYADKAIYEILQKYNPPSIVPRYAEQVMKIMERFGPEDIATANA